MKFRLAALLAVSVSLVAGCGGANEPEPEVAADSAAVTQTLPEGDGSHENPYVGRGFIEEIGDGQLVIQHETIPGWMPPMAMAFPVTEEVDLAEFAVGDQVMFDIELGGDVGYQVFRIEPVE